jgi:kinesin family protein 2/24
MIETNGKLESKIQPGDWRESMRPGMGVRLKRGHQAEPVRHVMVLCPEGAFGNEPGYQEMAAEGKQANTYVCAEILPAVMADAYNLAIDIQSVVSLDEMENEILLEFDHATRFYFINI